VRTLLAVAAAAGADSVVMVALAFCCLAFMSSVSRSVACSSIRISKANLARIALTESPPHQHTWLAAFPQQQHGS
jgi:hypothetical protein